MLGLEHDFRIVDTRATLDPGVVRRDPRTGHIPERLEREMLQAGVVRAVVSPGRRAAGRSYLRANNAVARLSIDRPFVAFARLNGPRDPRNGPLSAVRNLRAEREDHHARPDDVEQYSYDDRFHGFTLVPHADGLPNEDVLTRLEAADLPSSSTPAGSSRPRRSSASCSTTTCPSCLPASAATPRHRP